MKKTDLHKVEKLLNRLKNLPDVLHLRAAEIGYELSESEKQFLLETYEKLDDIVKETRAFINVKFNGREDLLNSWNRVDFDTKIGPIKVLTTDRDHRRRAWNRGIFDLESLLKDIRSEVVLMIEDDLNENSSTQESGKNSFSGNIIYNENSNYGNQSLSDNALDSPTIQKAKKPNNKTKKGRSWLEIAAWIAAIIGTILTIITLIIKS